MNNNIAHRLEQYTIKQPSQVLIVKIVIDEHSDEIVIFKGFSSSLMRPTAFNPVSYTHLTLPTTPYV